MSGRAKWGRAIPNVQYLRTWYWLRLVKVGFIRQRRIGSADDGDLGSLRDVRGGSARGGKRTLNPDASTTIYIFVSLSEMPCSRLYIPIPVSNFSSG